MSDTEVVVLAAGRGSRLESATASTPKCAVELAGVPLLDRLRTALRRIGNTRWTVVVGYAADKVHVEPGDRVIRNESWATTNIVGSLACALRAGALRTGGIVTYTDIVVDSRVLNTLGADSPGISVPLNTEWQRLWEARMDDPLSDLETTHVDRKHRILRIGGRARYLTDIDGQFAGMIELGPEGADAIRAAISSRKTTVEREDMTTLLQRLIDAGETVLARPFSGGWLEIDTSDDLEIYSRLEHQGQLAPYCDLSFSTP